MEKEIISHINEIAASIRILITITAIIIMGVIWAVGEDIKSEIRKRNKK